MDAALVIVRVIIGLYLAAHGAQKLFGWFGGYGIKGTGGFFESVGYRPGALFATLAGLGEFGGGLLTALGLLSPIGPVLIIIVMLNAMFSVHVKHGFMAANNGVELPFTNAAAALLLAISGPGAYSIDRIINFSGFADPKSAWIVVGIGIVIAFLNLFARRPAPAAQPQTQA